MDFFTAIQEAQAILHSRGVYRQVPLFTRGGHVYARQGTGFIRLMQGGTTSSPNGKWIEIYMPEEVGSYREHQGYVNFKPALAAAA